MTTATAGSPVVGVDLGGTKILARLVDPATGRATGRKKLATPTTGPDDVLDAVAAAVAGLVDDTGAEAAAVGIGVPGFVVDASTVIRCTNIVGWDDPIDVGQRLGETLGKPVVVGNDVNCGALAEHRLGAGRGRDDLLAVFVGTGVGGGLILNGRVLEGPRGMAGEIGHTMFRPGGRRCGCGQLGHVEAYASRSGIEREVRRRAGEGGPSRLVELAGDGQVKSRHLVRALDEGDELTAELLSDAVDALALAIGDTATLCDIGRVVLGGGVVDKLGQSFVDRIVASESFGGLGPSLCELRLAERLDDAGVAGAAILAVDHLDHFA